MPDIGVIYLVGITRMEPPRNEDADKRGEAESGKTAEDTARKL